MIFFWNFWGIFKEDFFGGIFLENFFGRNTLYTWLKSAKLFEYERDLFVKILSQCTRKKGRKEEI